MRMTPAEMRASVLDSNQIGSSGLTGVHTKVLVGDPAKERLLHDSVVRARRRHDPGALSHRDNRMAAVVSGEWHLGYGDQFPEPHRGTW